VSTDYVVSEARSISPTLAVLDVVDRQLQRYAVVIPYKRSDARSVDDTIRHVIAAARRRPHVPR
jgi:hypothetical protein